MILIRLTDKTQEESKLVTNFEYDVQSLVRAFYQNEEVIVNKDIDEETEMLIELEYLEQDAVINIYDDKYNGKLQLRMNRSTKVNPADRPDSKNKIKKLLYTLLSEYTSIKLPWGTLTGIRPIKIPMRMLANDRNIDEIQTYMKETYLISDKKLDLSLQIAQKELELLNKIDYINGYSIYIGIPFCPSTCAYCSFTSYPVTRYYDKVNPYIEALIKEIHYIAHVYRNKPLNTIYVGGGTPTTLNPDQLDLLLSTIIEEFDFSHVVEFTVEAGRPDSITKEKLMVLRKYGVTRISINPQTMNDATLKLIGRNHTVEQFKEAFYLARDCGFENINMDCIVGLPEETYKDVQSTMEQIYELKPDSITIHSLAIKRASRLNMFKEQYENCYFENDERVIDIISESTSKMGFLPYYLYRQKNMTNNLENVGYSLSGKEGIYNILIMEEKQTIVALGAGGISKFVFPNGERTIKIDNVKDVDLYTTRIDEMIERKHHFLLENAAYFNEVKNLEEELPESIAHGICVSNLAYAVARELGLSEDKCYELSVAGTVHDIGKLQLYSYINGKRENSLNIEQMKYIRMHSQLSYDILKNKGFSEFILESVLHHHESFDGSGFPDHLAGEDIPIGARILYVCDVFVALISKRHYRDSFDRGTAIALMIDEIKNYDMKVFIAFQRVIHEIDFKKITVGSEDIV